MRGFHELLVEWAWIPQDLDLDMNCFYLLLKQPATLVEGGETSVGMAGGKEVRIKNVFTNMIKRG